MATLAPITSPMAMAQGGGDCGGEFFEFGAGE
jgi:hypothetical protein